MSAGPEVGRRNRREGLRAMETMKSRLKGSKPVKVVSLLASLVLPACALDMATTNVVMDVVNPYYLLFLGFYGCIFLCLSWEGKWLWLKVVLVAANAAFISLFVFVAFMGGLGGPILALLQMVVPIVPWIPLFG